MAMMEEVSVYTAVIYCLFSSTTFGCRQQFSSVFHSKTLTWSLFVQKNSTTQKPDTREAVM